MEIDNLTFNDLPQAVSMLISQVSSMRSEVAQMRQQLQQARPEDNLILGRFKPGEWIRSTDKRLVGLVSPDQIYHRDRSGVPFTGAVEASILPLKNLTSGSIHIARLWAS